MILAIDGYEANVTDRVGVGRYAFELIRAMHELIRKGEFNCRCRIYLPAEPLPDMPISEPWWEYRVRKPRQMWTRIGLPLALTLDLPRSDVVFTPTHYAPRFISIPRVISIMDLSFLKYKNMFRPQDLYKLTHWTKISVGSARRIFTISEYSKHAIIDTYGLPSERVVVTYPGISRPVIREHMKHQDVCTRYGISKHYIFSVGTLQPRKNFGKLIEAFSIFLQKNRQKFGNIELVIAGKKGWLYEDILAAPAKYNVSGRVKFLDFVRDEDLPDLYENALCFALPSLYEGFGLPVAEAMAQSCPVVVSSSSSLPEIAGKAGIYVDPADAQSIAKGLLAAVRERNLMQGRWRIKQGLTRVTLFSWENSARKTLEVLTEVASK